MRKTPYSVSKIIDDLVTATKTSRFTLLKALSLALKHLFAYRQEALERNRVQAEKEEIEKLRLAEEEKQNELKLAERRAVQQLARKFALSVEGSVSISTPPEVRV